MYELQGKYGQAEPLYRQGVAIRKAAFGDQDESCLIIQANLASLYRRAGNYSAAEPLYEKTVALIKKVVGEQHSMYAGTLNGFAWLLDSEGKRGPGRAVSQIGPRNLFLRILA